MQHFPRPQFSLQTTLPFSLYPWITLRASYLCHIFVFLIFSFKGWMKSIKECHFLIRWMQIKEKGKGDLSIKLTGLLLVAEFHNSGAINSNSQVKRHQKALSVMSRGVYLAASWWHKHVKIPNKKKKNPTSLCRYKAMPQSSFLRRKCECWKSQRLN